MGFPLDQGSVRHGILTCHWHHARFDLSSGGTFDAFADDVPSFPVKIVDDMVWVDPSPPHRDEVGHWSARLEDGLKHNIRLVIAKAVLGLQAAAADYRICLRAGALFGTRYAARGWGAAMSILTCTANILPYLAEEDRPRALYQGLLHVARECAGQAPRFAVEPLPAQALSMEKARQWFRYFIDVRDAEGAERCLRTAIELGLPRHTIAETLYAAATDHIYLDGGHVLDYTNKALELLDHLGWELAGPVLSSLVPGMAGARRSEELNTWRQPVDIASLVWAAREELPALYEAGQHCTGEWDDAGALAWLILGDDPGVILTAIKDAIRAGATPEALGSAVAYAAFLRMARFHTANEFGDWDTVHNTLTAANALHQALQGVPSVELMRGLFDAAMRIYLDRFLNIPAQCMPERGAEPADEQTMLAAILERMDRQQQVEEVAQLVANYTTASHDWGPLLATLGHALLREDAGFHAFQLVEAAFRQYRSRRVTDAGRHLFIALGRYLAAHAPTPRASGQTYHIARRLQRGEDIHRLEH